MVAGKRDQAGMAAPLTTIGSMSRATCAAAGETVARTKRAITKRRLRMLAPSAGITPRHRERRYHPRFSQQLRKIRPGRDLCLQTAAHGAHAIRAGLAALADIAVLEADGPCLRRIGDARRRAPVVGARGA